MVAGRGGGLGSATRFAKDRRGARRLPARFRRRISGPSPQSRPQTFFARQSLAGWPRFRIEHHLPQLLRQARVSLAPGNNPRLTGPRPRRERTPETRNLRRGKVLTDNARAIWSRVIMVSHRRIGSRSDWIRVPKSALVGYERGNDELVRNLARPFATRQSAGYGHAGGSGWK